MFLCIPGNDRVCRKEGEHSLHASAFSRIPMFPCIPGIVRGEGKGGEDGSWPKYEMFRYQLFVSISGNDEGGVIF
jgi:hypothetical protein